MIIAFSFLSLLNGNYKDAIIEFNKFDNKNWLHYDVMDGKFVTNTTFFSDKVKEITKYNNLYNDVHLMIDNPNLYIEEYVNAGADQITIHYEAIKDSDIKKIISDIKTHNVKAGISIKPNTDISVLEEYLEYLDYILIMSVEPGMGGQRFIDSSLDKIKYLKQRQEKYKYLIGVDGGINKDTAKLVKSAGADVVVIGSYLSNNLSKQTMLECK